MFTAALAALALSAPAFAPPRPAPPGDLVPDLRAPQTLDEGGGEGFLDVLGIACALVPGFGIGHFFIGDVAGGIFFLLMEAGSFLAGGTVWLFGLIATVVTGGREPATALLANLGGVLALAGLLIVHVWQLIDLVIKVATGTPGSSGDRAAFTPPSAESVLRALR
jgi:hypothetical protein